MTLRLWGSCRKHPYFAMVDIYMLVCLLDIDIFILDTSDKTHSENSLLIDEFKINLAHGT